MRLPLSLKVSGWLLLNFVVLVVLAVVLLAATSNLSWNALVEGPPGRRMTALAESTFAELTTLSPADRETAIANFSTEHGVQTIWASGPSLAGNIKFQEMPTLLRDLLRPKRPAPHFGDGPSENRELPLRRKITLVRAGQPQAFWLLIPLDKPGGPRASVLIRVPDFTTLLSLLDLTPWLWIATGVTTVSILFWLPFVRGLTRDLARITHATEEIASGHFDTRVTTRRRDELGTLSQSVNHMATRLDRLVTGQKRFLGDIAHELGSPLGRMRVSVEILEQRADPSLRASIHDVREEVDHMAGLVEELLAFTRAGLQAKPAALTRVDLQPLVARVLTREAADDAVQVQVPDSLAVLADPTLLDRAIGNLVRNALRHAGRTCTITLRAEKSDTHILVIIEDDGPGVPADAIARLGEPLFRPDVARTHEGGGAGLGLAIVKTCTEACGGSVTFANRTPHGLSVTLRLTTCAD